MALPHLLPDYLHSSCCLGQILAAVLEYPLVDGRLAAVQLSGLLSFRDENNIGQEHLVRGTLCSSDELFAEGHDFGEVLPSFLIGKVAAQSFINGGWFEPVDVVDSGN
jgi:hypothetical protein